MRKPTRDTFFQAANGNARTRLFDESDWKRFSRDWVRCRKAASKGQSFYASAHGGSVANAYSYITSTAVYGMWVDPVTHKPMWTVHRATISGRSVPSPYYGGERVYLSDWNKMERMPLLRQYAVESEVPNYRVFAILKEHKDETASIAVLRAYCTL